MVITIGSREFYSVGWCSNDTGQVAVRCSKPHVEAERLFASK